jgi:dTMP kinase
MHDITQVRLRPHGLPGTLVAVDGSDGTGKTTLLDGLEEELADAGTDVLRTRQPTTEGRQLDAFKVYLFEPRRREEIDYRALLCMMIGDRLQHLHQVVLPALRAGRTVLCDRYIFTQMVTTTTRGHRDEPWMYELYSHVIAPDVGIVTDADLDIVCDRIGSRSDHREAFHEKDHVARNLLEFQRLAGIFGLSVVDTTRDSPAEVVDYALDLVRRVPGARAGAGQRAR